MEGGVKILLVIIADALVMSNSKEQTALKACAGTSLCGYGISSRDQNGEVTSGKPPYHIGKTSE
jgi:hypothetical protein